MKIIFIRLLLLALPLLASFSAQAGGCDLLTSVGGPPISERWESHCDSEHFKSNDPYNPRTYPAKFFEFTLARDADIQFNVSTFSRMYLISGTNKQAAPVKSGTNQLKSHLSAGTYILEVANTFNQNFTLTSRFNDIGTAECIKPITLGSAISDGWIPACQSQSRDIADPYSPVPAESHRARYYTFTLHEATDISAQVTSDVQSHMYILEGHNEFGAIQKEITSNSGAVSLTPGNYTLELTTKKRYDPGQFSLVLRALTNTNSCQENITLGQTLSGNWSPRCEILSWIPGNDDPYAGQNPGRAQYYNFTLNTATDVRFIRSAGNNASTILNLYPSGNYNQVLATTKRTSSYGSHNQEISKFLQPGSYTLEVTQYNKEAIGSFEIATLATSSDCTTNISLNQSTSGRLSNNCSSIYRGKGGNSDPYGVQQGEYFAKRYELTLNSATNIRINANAQGDSYLYLARKKSLGNQLLTQSWQSSHYRTTRYPQIQRELPAGTYIVEITSNRPMQEHTYSLSVNTNHSPICSSYLKLNQPKYGNISFNCDSELKPSIRNPNPYSYPNRFEYNSQAFTFEITRAATYELSTNSNSFGTHLFLVRGGDLKGTRINDYAKVSTGSHKIDYQLSPGLYTVEVTTTQANRQGNFSILLWDKTSQVENNCIEDLGILTVDIVTKRSEIKETCFNNSRNSNGAKDYYNKSYDFELKTQAALQIDQLSNRDSFLTLLNKRNGIWKVVHSNDNFLGYNSRINFKAKAGLYRIEASTYHTRTTGLFELIIRVATDTDGDGHPDATDAFPNDKNEWLDNDNDGLGNNSDLDDDNDGTLDLADAFPLNNNESQDSDGDGIGDKADTTPYRQGGDIRFSSRLVTVAENEKVAKVIITRTSPVRGTSLYYYTYDLSAKADKDYTPIIGTLVFSASELEKTLEVPILDNKSVNSKKDLRLMLVDKNREMSFSQGRYADISIEDNEVAPVTISFQHKIVSVNEEDELVKVIVTRDGSLNRAVNTYYKTSDATAIALQDYIPKSGQISFLPGEVEQELYIPIIKDTQNEIAEHFNIELINTSNEIAIINNKIKVKIEQQGNIESDTASYSFSVTEMQLEKSNRNRRITGAINRTGTVLPKASIYINVEINSLRSNLSGVISVEFEEGSKVTPLNFDVSPWFSSYSPMIETVRFTLNKALPLGIVSEESMLISYVDPSIVYEDYSLIVPSFMSKNLEIKEGTDSNITLLRLFNTSQSTTIKLQSFDGNAQVDKDYAEVSQEIDFEVGETMKSFNIKTINNEYHSEREFLIRLSHESGQVNSSNLPAPIKVKITDNEDISNRGILNLSSQQIFGKEADKKAIIVIQRLFGSVGDITASISTLDGTAKSGVNYSAIKQDFTLANGEDTKIIEIPLIDDALKINDLYFYADISTDLPLGNTTKLRSKVIIIDRSVSASSETPAKPKKKKSDKGFLGLGFINIWWLLILTFPLFFAKIRVVRKQ